MINMRIGLNALCCLLMLISSCSKKTFLSDEIKALNPYEVGQELIFESGNGLRNTITVTSVDDKRFPQGLGQFQNERMVVLGFRESNTDRSGAEERIIYFLAKDENNDERIDFCVSLRDTYLRMNFIEMKELRNLPRMSIETPYSSYQDVLYIRNTQQRRIFENEIVEFYWSKSKGYVKLVQEDGIEWNLVEIQ